MNVIDADMTRCQNELRNQSGRPMKVNVVGEVKLPKEKARKLQQVFDLLSIKWA